MRDILKLGAFWLLCAGSTGLWIYLAILQFSPWPPGATLRHFWAMPNCGAARQVGLAPAHRGEPGYWRHLDRDRDGWACEPWPPHRR